MLYWKYGGLHRTTAATFFTKEEEKAIVQSIREAEGKTSGEIRVHMETHCSYSVLDRAADVFMELGMHETEHRNGVLFYFVVHKHQFSVIGDVGIHSLVGDKFWEEEVELIESYFDSGRYKDGLVAGIKRAGIKLRDHFPYQDDDINELPDEISYGD